MAKKNISNPSTTLSITAATSGSRSSISAVEMVDECVPSIAAVVDDIVEGFVLVLSLRIRH
jgi:hypothetical protein